MKKDGQPTGLQDAGSYFHTDYSYLQVPARATTLYSRVVPKVGGDTLFANQQAAYDDLSDAMKKRIEPLYGIHHYGNRNDLDEKSRTVASVLTDEQKAKMPVITHRIARPHPVTGRKSLYAVSGSSFGIVGMPDDEARDLLDELAAHSTQPKYQLRFKYGVGDIVDLGQRVAAALGDADRPRRRAHAVAHHGARAVARGRGARGARADVRRAAHVAAQLRSRCAWSTGPPARFGTLPLEDITSRRNPHHAFLHRRRRRHRRLRGREARARRRRGHVHRARQEPRRDQRERHPRLLPRRPRGERRPRSATDDYAAAGTFDAVILALKAHQVARGRGEARAALPRRTPSSSRCRTASRSGTSRATAAPLAGRTVESVDPGGVVKDAIPASRILGCVVYPATELTAPGTVVHIEGDRFPLGELDGQQSRARAGDRGCVRAARDCKCPVLDNVRAEIWLKLWGNLTFNPISALTHATLVGHLRGPATAASSPRR